jgi:hypothetical protein
MHFLDHWLHRISHVVGLALFIVFCSTTQCEQSCGDASCEGGVATSSSIKSPWHSPPVLVGKYWVHLLIPQPRPEDRDIEIELNQNEPLDLSELLHALGEIPELPHTLSDDAGMASNSNSSIKLATNEQPLKGDNPAISKATMPVQPANPLRSSGKTTDSSATKPPITEPPATEVKSAEKPLVPPGSAEPPPAPIRIGGAPDDESPSNTSAKEGKASPSVTKDDEPLELEFDQATVPLEGSESNNDGEKTPEMKARPKMRTIAPAIKTLKTVSEDPKNDPSEDAKALSAERPLANQKTFVAKPSSARSADSSQGSPLGVRDNDRSQRVDKCLAYYLSHLETTVERSPWSVMHAMLPFGVEGEILVGNRKVNAIQWLSNNGTCRGQRLFTPMGRNFKANIGGGVQGHEGQFLAMLAQSQVSAEYPMSVGQNRYTLADLVRYEMATCRERSELTFKLIGLSYYLDTSQVWTTDRRSRWNIEKLVQEELAQPINGAACGGVHRLMGLTFAVRQRQAEGRPIDGQFARADKFIKDFVKYAWQFQNPDGSFSTNWFESRGDDPKMERKIQTTGHILEWLAFTLPEEELHTPRFLKSLDFILSKIWDEREHKWPIGPRGHATRAVALFQQRTQGVQPGERREALAEEIQSMTMRR